jgi:hypothetical protein
MHIGGTTLGGDPGWGIFSAGILDGATERNAGSAAVAWGHFDRPKPRNPGRRAGDDMGYRYSERNQQEYLRDGLTILRGLIPTSLLTDLRREAEKAREIARRERGPQAQRLEPVYNYPELDHRLFRDFLGLPELRKTVEVILGPDHRQSDFMSILLEPRDTAWCTKWHRDIGHNPAIDLDAFFDAAQHKPAMFSQLNGALYDDHSLWVVPGSDSRRDLEIEVATFGGKIPLIGGLADPPELRPEMTPEEREMICLNYTRAMPGAVNVALAASDVAFYRSVGWHTGNYVPYARRATLHDVFYGPEDRAWQANPPRAAKKQAATA